MKKLFLLAAVIGAVVAVVEWQKREITAQAEAWAAAGVDD